jgi:hypothetical protein
VRKIVLEAKVHNRQRLRRRRRRSRRRKREECIIAMDCYIYYISNL